MSDMIKFFIFPLWTIYAFAAEARTWKNHAGKTFEAEYVSNDGKRVTLRGKKRIVTYEIEKLHASDQEWLKENHPFNPEDSPPEIVKGAAFDTLEFGDSKAEVIQKLRKSKIVEGDVQEHLLARTGMSGIYRTKENIGGLRCTLYFEWSRRGTLREVSLRTQPLQEDVYDTDLKKNWNQWIELLTILHGRPRQDGGYPALNDLEDGLMLGSHLWYDEEGHSIILGTGQDGNKYSAIVRITSQRITVNRIQ